MQDSAELGQSAVQSAAAFYHALALHLSVSLLEWVLRLGAENHGSTNSDEAPCTGKRARSARAAPLERDYVRSR